MVPVVAPIPKAQTHDAAPVKSQPPIKPNVIEHKMPDKNSAPSKVEKVPEKVGIAPTAKIITADKPKNSSNGKKYYMSAKD